MNLIQIWEMIETESERKNWLAIDLDSVIVCHGLLIDIGYQHCNLNQTGIMAGKQ